MTIESYFILSSHPKLRSANYNALTLGLPNHDKRSVYWRTFVAWPKESVRAFCVSS